MNSIKFIGYGLLAISVILVVAFIATSNFTALEFPMVDVILNWTYIVLGLAIVLALIMPIYNMVKNPKGMVRSMIGMGIVVAVLLICYLMADDTPLVTAAKETFDNPVSLLLSDTGLYATYFAFAVAIITIVGGEILKVFKR